MSTHTYSSSGMSAGLRSSRRPLADFDGMDDVAQARAIGWASLAIGGLEIAATHMIEGMMGLRHHHGSLFRALGAREIAAGAAILSQHEPTPALATGLWSRVAGDAMDLALLAGAFRTTRRPLALTLMTAMVAGITMMDIACARKVSVAASS